MVVALGPDELQRNSRRTHLRADSAPRSRSVLISTDAGATWTNQTGDAQSPGESQHPDQHAIAFVPSDPDQMFLGSDGGVIRTNGTYTDISSQCDTRGLSGDLPVRLPARGSAASRREARADQLGTRDACRVFSIAVSHQDKNLAITGTQDNGSLNFSGSDKWLLGVTGDGGDAGFDAPPTTTRRSTPTTRAGST